MELEIQELRTMYMDVKVLIKTILIHFITREWIIYSYTMTAWIGKKREMEAKAGRPNSKMDMAYQQNKLRRQSISDSF